MASEEEELADEEKRLEMEVRQYEMLLKRAQVEAMQNEIEKLSPQKTNLGGFTDSRDRDGQAIQARRREMLKQDCRFMVPDFKRGWYVPVRALQEPVANTGTYNPNRHTANPLNLTGPGLSLS